MLGDNSDKIFCEKQRAESVLSIYRKNLDSILQRADYLALPENKELREKLQNNLLSKEEIASLYDKHGTNGDLFGVSTSNADFLVLLAEYLSTRNPGYRPIILNLSNTSEIKSFVEHIVKIAKKQEEDGLSEEKQIDAIIFNVHATAVSIRIQKGHIKVFEFDSFVDRKNNYRVLHLKELFVRVGANASKITCYSIDGCKGESSQLNAYIQVGYGCGEFAHAFLKFMHTTPTDRLVEISKNQAFRDLPSYFVKLSQSVSSLQYGLEGKENEPSNPKKPNGKKIAQFVKENVRTVLISVPVEICGFVINTKEINTAIIRKILKHVDKSLEMLSRMTNNEFLQLHNKWSTVEGFFGLQMAEKSIIDKELNLDSIISDYQDQLNFNIIVHHGINMLKIRNFTNQYSNSHELNKKNSEALNIYESKESIDNNGIDNNGEYIYPSSQYYNNSPINYLAKAKRSKKVDTPSNLAL